MIYLLIALLCGFLLGIFRNTPPKIVEARHTLLRGGIIFLVFTMGVSIGTNSQIAHNLKSIGGKALLFALSSALGALCCAYLTEKYLRERREKK